MLNNQQKQELIEAFEEELREMELYKNIGSSRVPVLKIDDLELSILVTRDDYEEQQPENEE